jgi:hypothetical protein
MPASNPIGVHALVWVGDTAPASIDHAIEQTRAAGFDLLELSLHDSTNLDTAAARKSLDAAGLQVACSRGLAFNADVSSEDPAVVARGEALLRESLAITHDLGGTHFTGALYSALGKYGRPLTAGGRANRLPRPDHVRVVLLRRGDGGPLQRPRDLAQPLVGRRGPGPPRARLHHYPARGEPAPVTTVEELLARARGLVRDGRRAVLGITGAPGAGNPNPRI